LIGRFLPLSIVALTAVACAWPAAAATAKKPTQAQMQAQKRDQAFRAFVASLWAPAQERGVSRETFDAAFEGVTFNPKVEALAKNQPEFTLTIPRYLDGAVSGARIERGRAAALSAKLWLDKEKAAYHVDPATVMGVWGIETDFGAFPGTDSTIRSLASLAFIKFRDDYFRDELLAALVILQSGDIGPEGMKGSWAGAMGQTQFMPSNYLAYAVDFEGHGRRDIWGSAADAVGSTANYLAQHGWVAGLPWGFEVRLPADFSLTEADSLKGATFDAFAARGVARVDGQPLPKEGEGRLLILAGLRGPIFLVTANFDVIKSYNPSTAYALAVALLGDGIAGGSGVQTEWPKPDRPLAEAQVRRLQATLKTMGYGVGKIDGKPGDALRAAVCAWQERHGLAPDGYADLALLKRVGSQK
jgi:membrane-bound lytic murein transglycosylase B